MLLTSTVSLALSLLGPWNSPQLATLEPQRVSGILRGPGNLESPRIAPDGSRIAYSWARDGHAPQIFVARRDGSDPRQITPGPAAARSPRWSPDGRSIAFVSQRAIWIARPDSTGGYSPTRVAGSESICCAGWASAADWSPDGLFFAYSAGDSVETWIAVLPAAGGSSTQLTVARGGEWFPVWSPAGDRIAFYSTWGEAMTDVWNMARDGSDLIQITSHPGEDFRPAWSPDGSWIAYTSRRSGKNDLWASPANGSGRAAQLTDDWGIPLDAQWNRDSIVFSYHDGFSHVWAVDPTDGTRTPLTSGTFNARGPSAAPDGQWIAVSTDHFSPERGVALIPARGGEMMPLTVGDGLRDHVAWSRDSRHLAFMWSVGGYLGDNDIWTFDMASRAVRQLDTLGAGSAPAWAPGGRVYFVAWGNVYSVDADGADLRSEPGPGSGVRSLDVSGDGSLLLFTNSAGTFTSNVNTGATRQILLPPGSNHARWSPDSGSIAFIAPDAGVQELWTAAADGSAPRRITRGLHANSPPSWAPDARTIYVSADNANWHIGSIAAPGLHPH